MVIWITEHKKAFWGATLSLAAVGLLLWGIMALFHDPLDDVLNYKPDEEILYTQPVQENFKGEGFVHNDFYLEPVAHYAIEALILSRENYWWDNVSDLSPTDFVLGWNLMAEPSVAKKVSIFFHSFRQFFFWTSSDAMLDKAQIDHNMANVHIIPANDKVKQQIDKLGRGDFVRFEGYLVNVSKKTLQWRTSLSRTDNGFNKGCEIIYVEYVKQL
jgi:hypothetical protein